MGKSSQWFMQIQEENLRDNLDAEFEEHKIKLESTEQPREGDAIQPLNEIFELFGKIFGSNEGRNI
tara:strand:+ start:583 stop:780 length:198 start_codon:yes stop_codon:yes gene_type:complete